MNKQTVTAAITLALAYPSFAEGPDLHEVHDGLAEAHNQVIKRIKQVRDAVVPAPAIHFVENFPPVAVPRAKVLQLAQAEPVPVKPIPVPPVDVHGIAEWANDFAVATTEGALSGMFSAASKARRPLIVSASERDAKSIAALEEDLNVMMRILEKAANPREEAKQTAMGIELVTGYGSSSPRVFYLDGYGPMFILCVKYPLLAPPKKDDESRTNETTSSEWERTKEEVFGTRPAFRDVRFFDGGQSEPFDEERVDNLKEQIIGKLGEATHIRNIKDSDYITVVVLGTGPRVTAVSRSGKTTSGRGGGVYVAEARRSSSDTTGQTTMTLRAKKSDVDAFAKGKMKSEEFRKKVSVQVY